MSSYRSVIQLADAGYIKLPDAVDKALQDERRRESLRPVHAAASAALADMREARDRSRLSSWEEHARQGTWPVDVDSAAQARIEELTGYVEWLGAQLHARSARWETSERDAAISRHATEIVETGLRPALEGLLAEVREVAPTLPSHMTERDVLGVGGEVRVAFERLTALASLYGLLRDAQFALTGADPLPPVGEYRDAPVHFGGRWLTRGQNLPGGPFDPAPAEPVARLVWIATRTQAWMPTRAELAEWSQRILQAQKSWGPGKLPTLADIEGSTVAIGGGSDSLTAIGGHRVVAPFSRKEGRR